MFSLLLVVGTAQRILPTGGALLLLFGYLFAQGSLYPNTTALALEPFEKNAGVVSGLMGFLQSIVATLASMLVSVFHNGTAVPMVGVMAGCAGIGFGCLLGGELLSAATRKRAEAH